VEDTGHDNDVRINTILHYVSIATEAYDKLPQPLGRPLATALGELIQAQNGIREGCRGAVSRAPALPCEEGDYTG
jgi:hypothetical protein